MSMDNNCKGRRVVVTGMGTINPIGKTLNEFWSNLLNGKSGISRIDCFDTEKIDSKIAGQVRDFAPQDLINFKDLKRMDRFTQFAVIASINALKDSGLEINENNNKDAGVFIGSGVGGLATIEEQHKKLLEKGADRVSPFLIPMMICNMAAAQVSIFSGAKGPVNTTTTACAAGSNAIGDAFELIKRGAADIMIAGGSEAAITPLGMAGFSSMHALSTRNDEPEAASRPFERDRDGFVMGEGAGILILEELEHAFQRDAKIYAELSGYGLSGEAYHITALEESGVNVARAMENCLKEAGFSKEKVGYINAHGTSTPLNDIAETNAIKLYFGKHAYKLNISSTKSMHGHCLGAAGAIESIATVLTVFNSIIPPTINYFNQDKNCDLNYTPNKAIEKNIDIALKNSMGFGGHNVTLAFKRFKG
ncbi:MAG: beta-ketoacyl-ACP synthase II [Actinomycetota bacterium]|nr:beta-ketoacyl-ACP synthase II [Actinomycetota bacterium]